MKIVIPTLGRVDIIEKHPLREVADLLVAEREYDLYHARYPDMTIWAHPDTVKNIAQARNYVLEEIRKPEDRSIVMFDDDLECCIYTMSMHYQKHYDVEYMVRVLERTEGMAIDAGAGIFGFAHTPRPQERDTFRPFSLRGWVNCRSIGIIDPDLRFDPFLTAKEDFDICLQSLQKNRIVWMDKRYVFLCEHWTNAGGLQETRTTATEEKDNAYMRRKWGTKVMVTGVRRNTGMSLSIGVR